MWDEDSVHHRDKDHNLIKLRAQKFNYCAHFPKDKTFYITSKQLHIFISQNRIVIEILDRCTV